VLAHAYALCKANGGAPGPDGETFEDIETRGSEALLKEPTGPRWRWQHRREASAQRLGPAARKVEGDSGPQLSRIKIDYDQESGAGEG
jgi:hypothetical protein